LNLRHSVALILAFGAGCQTTADRSPTHMLRLICESAAGSQTNNTSRIAVLDIGDHKYDFGFATGHGIPPERPCLVKDFEGRERSVDMIRLANDYKAGQKTDWAVIRFDRISTPGLVRYALEPINDLSVMETAQFSFAQARGLPENAQRCSLSILDFKNGRRRVSHDCRAIPGQSGSPITRIVEGTHKLVGLHIGHIWMLESPATGRPDRKGYINLLDQNTVEEIRDLIDENRN